MGLPLLLLLLISRVTHDHGMTHLFARCCPVVSWFMETMAELGCCPPSSNMENKSNGTEHMFVSART